MELTAEVFSASLKAHENSPDRKKKHSRAAAGTGQADTVLGTRLSV